MPRWAAFFLVLTVTAAVIGFGGAPAPWAEIAKAVALIAFVVFLAALIASAVIRRRPPSA